MYDDFIMSNVYDAKEILPYVRKRIPGEFGRMTLFTPYAGITHETLRNLWHESIQNKFDAAEEQKAWQVAFDNSRIARQKAGLVFPVYALDAYIANPLTFREKDGQLHAVPNTAIIHSPNAASEFESYDGVETFYFKHSTKYEIGYTVEELWPDEKTDFLLLLYLELAKIACKDYLEEKKCAIMDRDHGIIDRGYYL
jgi:hypothetical protein